MVTVCKDCKDRTITPNCHTTCEKYLNAVEKHNETKKMNKNNISIDFTLRKLTRKRVNTRKR